MSLLDVVIPVHRADRPVERAVASCLDGARGTVRVLVVCHDLGRDAVTARLAPFGEAVELLELHDGIPSPAGPWNVGIEAATAPYVTFVSSDDHLRPGAADAILTHLRRRPVDALLLRTYHEATDAMDLPPVRPRRLRDLDIVRDRLSYRVGPQVVARTALLHDHGIRMTPGLRTGEDLGFSTRLYATARRIDLVDPGAPAYVAADDGGPRVTREIRPLSQQIEAAARLASEDWIHAAPGPVRRAIAVRVLRHSVYRYLARGCVAAAAEARVLRDTVAAWVALAPDATGPLAAAERRLTRDLADGIPVEDVPAAVNRLLAAPRWSRVLPSDPLYLADRESRLRIAAAVALGDSRTSLRHARGPEQ